MSVRVSTRSMKQIRLNPLILVLLVGAIYSGSASAARLLSEDRDFSISHTTANPAAFDLMHSFVTEGSSSSQQPESHSDVARLNSARDGIGNVLDVKDIAHPGGRNTINAETAAMSFKAEIIHSRPRWFWSPGYNNKNVREFVFNVFPKGAVTPSGPGHKGYAMVSEQRLSASKHSPGVGHMQENSKRILSSVPSPGAGHHGFGN